MKSSRKLKPQFGCLSVLFLSLVLPMAAQERSGGTTNYIPIWTSGTTLGDSTIYEANGMVGINATTPSATLQVIGQNGTSGSAPTALQVIGGNGASGGGHNGGPIVITSGGGGGSGFVNAGAGGLVGITAGNGGGGGSRSGGTGGTVAITAGTGGKGGLCGMEPCNPGTGGVIQISGGGGGGGGSTGGSVLITGGSDQRFGVPGASISVGGGSGGGGSVQITGGADSAGAPSTITLQPGAGQTRLGSVNLAPSGGLVGVGTASPANTLEVVTGGTTLADEWTTRSSRRFKTNIQPLAGALEKVEQLQGVSYERRTDGKHEIGVVAEDVDRVVPEIVSHDPRTNQTQGVDYSRLAALLIEAVKSQQIELQTQQGEIQRLKVRLGQLTSSVPALDTKNR